MDKIPDWKEKEKELIAKNKKDLEQLRNKIDKRFDEDDNNDKKESKRLGLARLNHKKYGYAVGADGNTIEKREWQ